VVTGTEHFADALTSMACAATPVTDGAGEMIGVIDLTCSAEDFNPLLLPFAKRAAREIGHRLGEGVNPRRLTARSWLSLTDTERAVAHLVAQGLSSRIVADRMRLPQPTVRSHLRRVFRKLGVRSQVELARVVEQNAARAQSSRLTPARSSGMTEPALESRSWQRSRAVTRGGRDWRADWRCWLPGTGLLSPCERARDWRWCLRRGDGP
jgi:DNA-binding CsgD family transcriptional regulator